MTRVILEAVSQNKGYRIAAEDYCAILTLMDKEYLIAGSVTPGEKVVLVDYPGVSKALKNGTIVGKQLLYFSYDSLQEALKEQGKSHPMEYFSRTSPITKIWLLVAAR